MPKNAAPMAPNNNNEQKRAIRLVLFGLSVNLLKKLEETVSASSTMTAGELLAAAQAMKIYKEILDDTHV